MARNSILSKRYLVYPLVFLAAVFFREILCKSRDDYAYPEDYQEDTEAADPPEEFANETIPEGPPPNDTMGDTYYPPEKKMKGRSFMRDGTYKWKTMNVYIERSEFTPDEVKIINKAVFQLYKILKPCGVHIGVWKPGQTPFGDYVKIINQEGCHSALGRFGGEQIMSLSTSGGGSCVCKKVIIHEFLHALGFNHEQSRPDRDEHVEILWNNIEPSQQHNYEKDDGNTFGIPYNEKSIMHYHDDFFAKPGTKAMKSKKGKALGWEGDMDNPLQPSDIEMLKKAYCTAGKK